LYPRHPSVVRPSNNGRQPAARCSAVSEPGIDVSPACTLAFDEVMHPASAIDATATGNIVRKIISWLLSNRVSVAGNR
jgi:hypothetical protein